MDEHHQDIQENIMSESSEQNKQASEHTNDHMIYF